MAGFKRTPDIDRLHHRQRGGVIVFVESEDDYQIFAERWFFDIGEKLTFESADRDTPERGGGGCGVVCNLVDKAIDDGICAFGIIDRDSLMNNDLWEIWWEENDERFLEYRPFGDRIRVLLRWELENYLLDAKAMEIEIADERFCSPRSSKQCAQDCLKYASELKNIASAHIVLQRYKCGKLNPGFGSNPPHTGAKLHDKLIAHLDKKSVPTAQDTLAAERTSVDRFDRPDADVLQRWERLSRMVDGKGTLKYLGSMLQVPLYKRRAALASRIREQNRIPADIQGYVDEFLGC
ncbi:hypothetical protein QUF90_19340 [Desulfococcaceae bacterium HSG9]|nr:hypothetical protein [Desulfococcaceae bacterium HSG9]